jgi:hypothetical protein
MRDRNDRTSIIGLAINTSADSVIKEVTALGTEKVTAVYPDGAVISIDDPYGNSVEYVVNGAIIAAAMAGLDTSPVSDIATTLTNNTLVGFNRLYRRLDNVTASLIANAGCTVLEQPSPGVVRVMMYLTTDLSTPLTRDPRIVEVKHFVQQGIRNVLSSYIGVKNLPRVIPQIQSTVGSYFSALKRSGIIYDFKPASVTQDPSDPSTLDVEAFYSPVYPVNWIVVTLTLSSTL